jgi:FKBP-type peptidyl-prolyl cis-trans isomerase FklB
MKQLLIAVGIASLAVSALAAGEEVALKDQKDKISYGVGVNIGRSLTNNAIAVNVDALAAGIRSVMGGKELLSTNELNDVMNAFNNEMRAKQQERFKQMQAERESKQKDEGAKNKKAGDEFLAVNKKKEGVKVLPIQLANGQTAELQYKIITEGKGAKPATNDTVVTHYRGTLLDGTEFDSSYKRGEPASFPVTGVIRGWTEALLRMPVGSKWQLFIPAELAYGPSGSGRIPSQSTLQFDIELISIKGKEQK